MCLGPSLPEAMSGPIDICAIPLCTAHMDLTNGGTAYGGLVYRMALPISCNSGVCRPLSNRIVCYSLCFLVPVIPAHDRLFTDGLAFQHRIAP